MATIKDVAKEAGLAVSTVSRILNNRGYISEEARKKVNDAMEKLNYQPNELARSLHKKNSNIIGLIVPHVKHPYFAEVISRIEDQAYKKGYRVLLCNSQTINEREDEYVEICKRNRVAGIIMCTGGNNLGRFKNLGVPVIAWERFIDNGLSVVECDNVNGGMLAAQHLIDKGCKNLLHFGMKGQHKMPGDYRYLGFKKVCDQNNMSFHEEFCNPGYDYKVDHRDHITEILKKYPDTDGIFCNNDIMAAQTLQACHMLGISVPDQIKVIGYDDVFFASLTTPALTTIHQPIKEMAAGAVSLLDAAINGKRISTKTMLTVKLVEREST